MPYATNRRDGVRTYFEDSGGSAPPVVVYPGFTDPIEYAKGLGLVRALTADFRLIFADHRGQGRSDKPHEVAAYALRTRVADAVAVLDELGVERSHFLGSSWGARLGFAIGEHAPERVLSLVLCGNQPYPWDTSWPFVPALSAGGSRCETRRHPRVRGGDGVIVRRHVPGTDPDLDPGERPSCDRRRMGVSDGRRRDLAGSHDVARAVPHRCAADEMHANAERAAGEVPGATFVSLAGHGHLSAEHEWNNCSRTCSSSYAARPDRRSARPGSSSVRSPPSTTRRPFTITYGTPSGSRRGSS